MDFKSILKAETQEDIIIIKDDDTNEVKEANYISEKSKKHHKGNRKVKLDTSKERETLIITQKFEVKKQKIECIINLTNIYECKVKTKKKKKTKTLNEDRIVPICLRKTCKSAINFKCCERRRTKEAKRRKKSSKLNKDVQDKYRNKLQLSLSSISPPKQEECYNKNITYENISSDSFSSDNYLDTLIKRTKDRERKLSQTFDDTEAPLCASTPKYVENVSDDENVTIPSTEMDTSLHSLVTLVLEPQLDAYSPTYPIDSVEQFDNATKNTNISPPRLSENYPYNLPLKFETTQIYSPIEKISNFDQKQI